MKINPINYIQNTPVLKERARVSPASSAQDDYKVSIITKEYALALREARAASDIRENLVNDIQASIQNGSYFVSSADIAGKILGDL